MQLSNNIQRYGWCMSAEMICVLLITIFTMLSQFSLVSLVFSISFIVLFVACAQKINYEGLLWNLLICFGSCVIAVLLNLLLNGTSIVPFDYFKKMIMFLTTVIFFIYASHINVKNSTIKLITNGMLICSVCLPFSYFILGNKMKYANLITINYLNPNFTGMWLLVSIVFLTYLFFSIEKLLVRYLVTFILLIEIYLLVINNTRSCIFAFVFFSGLLVYGYIFRRTNISKLILIIVLLFPLIFAILYMILIEKSNFMSNFDFMVSEGKSLTSRVFVWENAFHTILTNPILGDYWGISNGTGQSQMHNTALDVCASYGIFVYVLSFINLYKSTSWIFINKSWLAYVAMSGFLAIWVSGCFEAALVSGSMGLAYYAGMLLLLSKHQMLLKQKLINEKKY